MDNQEYQVYTPEEPNDNKGLAVASLICGIISFFCVNPCYLVSLAAIITGCVYLGKKGTSSKGMAIAGLILGIASIVIGVIVDLCLIPITFGTSFFF